MCLRIGVLLCAGEPDLPRVTPVICIPHAKHPSIPPAVVTSSSLTHNEEEATALGAHPEAALEDESPLSDVGRLPEDNAGVKQSGVLASPVGRPRMDKASCASLTPARSRMPASSGAGETPVLSQIAAEVGNLVEDMDGKNSFP